MMALENGQGHAPPSWFVSPGEQDFFAWLALALAALAVYGIFYLYAKFDTWAEHRSKGTPLAKTIPTMLAIALLYEIFPLGHFNILLPIAAILIALMADWSHYRFGPKEDAEVEHPGGVSPPVAVQGTAERVGPEDIGKISEVSDTEATTGSGDQPQATEYAPAAETSEPAEERKPATGETQSA